MILGQIPPQVTEFLQTITTLFLCRCTGSKILVVNHVSPKQVAKMKVYELKLLWILYLHVEKKKEKLLSSY